MFKGTVVVIDNGTHMTRAGLAGDRSPRVIIPTVVGHPSNQASTEDTCNTKVCVGDEALTMREKMTLTYPIQRGSITDWDDMTKIWDHCFTALHTNPRECVVMLT